MRRLPHLALLLFCASLASLLIWRAFLPQNRFRPGRSHFFMETHHGRYFIPKPIHDYDDVVTVLTARHFVRDGFTRTHFLPNRSGTPTVSFLDRTQSQCEQLVPQGAPMYRSPARWMPMRSLTGDCIYTHYPPLADWTYAGLALLGASQLVDYKIAAIALNAAFLVALFYWLSREVSTAAALVATACAGTLPGFFFWADALYYQPLQQLFLLLGLHTWGLWLRKPRRLHYAATWGLYFCESLVSYELTFFYGIALVGMTALKQGTANVSRQLRACTVQGLAPIAALSLQLALSCSLFGPSRALANITSTFADRMTEGCGKDLVAIIDQAGQELVPWWFIGLGLALLLVEHRISKAPLKRPLGILLTLLLGGASFSLLLPGTAAINHSIMYRHLLLFMVFAVAVVGDVAVRSLSQLWARWRHLAPTRTRVALAVCAACAACAGAQLGYLAFRNASDVALDVEANLGNSRSHAPTNLAHTALDVIYWADAGQAKTYLPYLPVSGLRVNEPPGCRTDFRITGPGRSHYEIWWLEPQPIKTVRLLVDEDQAASVIDHCFLSGFSRQDFESFPSGSRIAVKPFIPEPTERSPRAPYAWVEATLPAASATRAIRITCSGLDRVALRQVEAYSVGNPT